LGQKLMGVLFLQSYSRQEPFPSILLMAGTILLQLMGTTTHKCTPGRQQHVAVARAVWLTWQLSRGADCVGAKARAFWPGLSRRSLTNLLGTHERHRSCCCGSLRPGRCHRSELFRVLAVWFASRLPAANQKEVAVGPVLRSGRLCKAGW